MKICTEEFSAAALELVVDESREVSKHQRKEKLEKESMRNFQSKN